MTRLDVSPKQQVRAISSLHTLLEYFDKKGWVVEFEKHPYEERLTTMVEIKEKAQNYFTCGSVFSYQHMIKIRKLQHLNISQSTMGLNAKLISKAVLGSPNQGRQD
ncbi:hypothetical protein CWE13_08835 [Aliidiomarina shirensis]|uniref:Uncharacterized protein n=2 Tax=Aliidiomarina shirensis TaxID=1048642 RepID=A0A432WT42_9GAMM|nr:hypothetical protein CWE13_08835 [Aliidiomarina shirensis]